MGEDDDDVIHHLQCDVELVVTGPSDKILNQWTATILRRLADQLERNEFQSGFHDAMDNTGKRVGTIYVDYSGEI